MAAPDAAAIERDWKHLDTLWARALEHWRTLDSYYWRTYQVWDARHVRRFAFRPSRPTNLVDIATDNLLAFQPKVHVFPTKTGVGVQEARADLKERFLQAVFAELALQATSLTWKQAGRHLNQYGYAVVQGPELDLAGWKEQPERERGEKREDYEDRVAAWEVERGGWCPFTLDTPHPARVHMDPREKKPGLAVLRYKQYAQTLAALTEKKQSHGKTEYVWQVRDNPYELVTVTEWWDETWHALSAEGAGLLYTERNTWGFVPFAHAFAGNGMEVADLADFDPSYWAKGLLSPVLESIRVEAQQASARHNAIIERAFARLKTDQDPAELAQMMAEDDILPMGPTEWLQYPDLTTSMFAAAQDVARDIEEGTFSRVLAGERPQGVTTGVQQGILTSMAVKKFEAPLKQLESLATIVGSRVLMLLDRVEELGGSLTIRGARLTKADIAHNYYCQVAFELVDPAVQAQQADLGLRVMQTGHLSEDTFWEQYLRLEDASGERERILADRLRQHPWFIAKAMAALARQEGKEELAQQFEEEAASIREKLLGAAQPGAGSMSPMSNGRAAAMMEEAPRAQQVG